MNNTEKSVENLAEIYLKSLDEKEMIAYNIAKSHLGTLFTLEKSNHYLDWLSAHNSTQKNL